MNFWNSVASTVRNLKGYSDCHTLIADFNSNCRSKKINPSIQELHQYIKVSKDDTAIKVLIVVFGCLPSNHVVSRIRSFSIPLLNRYQEELNKIIKDCGITLQYHVQDLKLNKTLSFLPSNVCYSWNSKSYFDATNDREEIKYWFALGLFTLPMPSQLAKIFTLHEIDFLQPHLEQHANRYALLISRIYTSLIADGDNNISLASHYRETKEFLQAQQLLMKSIAYYRYPRPPSSWMKELQRWGKTTIKKDCIQKFIRDFSLISLVSKSVQPIFNSSSSPLSSPLSSASSSASSSPSSSPSSSLKIKGKDRISEDEEEEEHEKPSDQELASHRSFQDYLIEKTIHESINSYCPLSVAVKKNLADAFKEDENQRLDFIFFLQLLDSVFRPVEKELKPTLSSLIEKVLPLTRDFQNVQRTQLLFNRIFPDSTEYVTSIAYAFFQVYIFDYLNEFQTSQSRKHQRFESLLLSSQNDDLNFSVVNDEYTALVKMKKILAPELPPGCLKQLFKEYLEAVEGPSMAMFGCLYEWFLLYGSYLPCIDEMYECLKQQGIKVDKQVKKDKPVGPGKVEKQYFASLIDKGMAIFDKQGFQSTHVLYNVLHATLHLINFRYYLNLDDAAQQFFFERIFNASQKERNASAQELNSFISSLAYSKNSSLGHLPFDQIQLQSAPMVMRKEMLLKAYTPKQNSPPALTILWNKYKNQLNERALANFQIEFLNKAEAFIQNPFPLVTLYILSLYSPFFPITPVDCRGRDTDSLIVILDKINELAEIRKTLNLYSKETLFLSPSIVKQIDECYQSLFDPSVCHSAHFYGSGSHISNLEIYKGGVVSVIQAAILPPFHFGTEICEQASTMFSDPMHSLPDEKQNVICLSIEHSDNGGLYVGEWSCIVYIAEWTLKSTSQGTFPHLNLTLLCSLDHPESCHLEFTLQISTENLNKELEAVLHAMMVTLVEETPLAEHEERIQGLMGEEEEWAFCLELYTFLREKWENYVENDPDRKKHGLELFKFVRKLKIEVRKAQVFLHMPIQERRSLKKNDESQSPEVCHNLIHYDEYRFYLEDGHRKFIFELLHQNLQTEFTQLCDTLRSCQTKEVIEHFCELKILKEIVTVSILFDPLFQDTSDTQEGEMSEKEPEEGTSGGTPPNYNQVTMTLNSLNAASVTYSLKYKQFMRHDKLEKLLRWQLLVLLRCYIS